MVKEPRAGRVKTRLAAEVGIVEATRAYRSMVAHVLARAGSDPRWRTVLAVAPDIARASPMLPAGYDRVGQGPGTLGCRLERLIRLLPSGPVVIIGSDSPQLRPTDVAAAFAVLARSDAVLGPSPDGGYWLIGVNRLRPWPRQLFRGVSWSSASALADTRACFEAARGPGAVTLLNMNEDCDDAASFGRQRQAVCRRILPSAVPDR
jgi:uncharacterized protein